MSLFTTSLNSGSNGNCYYVGNNEEAVFIDAGISCKETEKRMQRLNLSMKKVKAIFVSHEHSDHTKGVETLSKKFQLPVYISKPTLLRSGLQLQENLIHNCSVYASVSIGNLIVTPFLKKHDAIDPYSFVVACDTIKVGIFTDVGAPCENIIKHFKQCHAAFLEANYDEQMLKEGNYPYHLKKRISGGLGHLSNKQALEVFLKYKPTFMSHLFLSHLSQNNNCPQLVENLFKANANGVEMIVASRYIETPVYCIQKLINSKSKIKHFSISPQQLAFSF